MASFISIVRSARDSLKIQLDLYRGLYRDPRTPRLARWLLWAAIGYLALPFDIIPDFIPILGHVDDVVIVPLLLVAAVRLIPPPLMEEHRQRARSASRQARADDSQRQDPAHLPRK